MTHLFWINVFWAFMCVIAVRGIIDAIDRLGRKR